MSDDKKVQGDRPVDPEMAGGQRGRADWEFGAGQMDAAMRRDPALAELANERLRGQR